MKLSQSKISCGVRQLHELYEDPMDNIGDIGWYLYHDSGETWSDAAFIMWSDVVFRNGRLLYDYIKETFPSSFIYRTPAAKNPNSDNTIEVYTWKLPEDFEQWWEDNYDSST